MTRSGPPGAGVRQRNNCGRNCLREWGQTKFKFAIFMASGKPKIMGGGDGGYLEDSVTLLEMGFASHLGRNSRICTEFQDLN